MSLPTLNLIREHISELWPLLQDQDATAQLTFTVLNSVPNAFIPVNPLGIQVTHLRVDQAF